MSRLMKRPRQLQPILAVFADISTEWQPLGHLQSHSCLHPLQKHLSDHPDIGQGKQGHKLCGVLDQPAVTHLAVTELAFDHPEWVFHFGAHTGLELLSLFTQRPPGRVPLLLAFARAHSNVPVHARGLISLGRTLVTRVSEDNLLLPMQQCMSLGHIVDVGSGADDGVHQAGISVHADVAFHAEVPLISLLGLMHLGVPLAGLVLGGTRCRNQCGVYHAASLEQQAVGGEFGVDDLQNLGAQVVFFEQVSEPQNADPIGDALGATDAYEVTVETGLEQGLFSPQIRQAKPLLQAVNAQHHCKLERWASRLGHRRVRSNQCQQLSPWHDPFHFIEQDLFARSPRIQIKAKVGLLHVVIDRNLRASVT